MAETKHRLNLAEVRLFMRASWQHVTTEQHNGKWLDVMMSNGEIIRAHWAQDMSGEEQPPYRGWYREMGSIMGPIDDPILWRAVGS
jgi:desulfoferrodoxin (superoxide reductase-like protein)